MRVIRAGQTVHRTARLVVDGIPEKTSMASVQETLEVAGKAVNFTEGGVPWGNHEIQTEKKLPAGVEGIEAAEAVAWESLKESKEFRRITLRMPPQDYGRITQAAARSGKSVNAWCIETLTNAADREK